MLHKVRSLRNQSQSSFSPLQRSSVFNKKYNRYNHHQKGSGRSTSSHSSFKRRITTLSSTLMCGAIITMAGVVYNIYSDQEDHTALVLMALPHDDTMASSSSTKKNKDKHSKDKNKDKESHHKNKDGDEKENHTPKDDTKDNTSKKNTQDTHDEGDLYFDYVIIGGGPAGYSAYHELTNNSDGKILIVSSESYPPYSRPLLSQDLWDTEPQNDEEKLFFQPFDDYDDDKTIILLNTTVERLSPKDNLLKLDNGSIIRYGSCLIATGSKPIIPDIKIPESDKISTYRNLNDFENLYSKIEDGSVDITIIGGGLLGTELSYNLAKNPNNTIKQIIKEDFVMGKYFPSPLSEFVTNDLKQNGVNIFPNSILTNITTSDGSKLIVSTTTGDITTDFIVFAIGTTPNVALAESSLLEIDQNNGGVVANSQLSVLKDLYAAGDVVSVWNPNTKRTRISHITHAFETGRTAAKNMMGGAERHFIWSAFWGTLGNNKYEAFGEIDSTLETVSVWQKDEEGSDGSAWQEKNDYQKGITYYLRNKQVVGVLTWNIPDKIGDALRAVNQDRDFDDYSDLVRVVPFENKQID